MLWNITYEHNSSPTSRVTIYLVYLRIIFDHMNKPQHPHFGTRGIQIPVDEKDSFMIMIDMRTKHSKQTFHSNSSIKVVDM